jgi:hypothetical protein
MNGLEQVTQLADRLPPAEQLKLVEHLAQRLQQQTLVAKKPVCLRGSWKDAFPEDFDVDAALKEIRSEWEKEMDFDL